jgi:nifR3 family TIM-barrel protein
MAFALGPLQLSSNLFLAPLAGYTNLPFRLIIREIGSTCGATSDACQAASAVGLCTTDLVNARSLLEKNRKALELVATNPGDHPLAAQLYGTVPEEMRDAALLLQSLGLDAVDVNMGCPVRKVCRNGGGSALMHDLARAAQLVRTMVGAVKIPVTCKMRLGWNDATITAPGLARALEDVGVAAITVHGRTRQQGFSGRVNLTGIRAVAQAVKRIPVIGNGDITTPQAAKQMFDETGCAAVSIGRGAFYNPWIFQHTAHYLATGELLPEPTFDQRLAVMRRHLDLMVDVFGEEHGCRKFRKVALQYSKRFGPTKEFDCRIVRLGSRAEFDQIVAAYRAWRAQFLDDRHQLRQGYEPRPLEEVSTISVPPGPNELW